MARSNGRGMGFFYSAGEILSLLYQSICWCRAAPANLDKIVRHMYEFGNATLPIGAILAVFTGGVLALQAGSRLAEFGAQATIGGIVGASMAKELGPVMISLLVAGRVGSAMAAEVGAMSVYEEIDALRTLHIDPVRYLVMPRLIASFITLPFLTLYGTVIGWLGGAVVSNFNAKIRVNFSEYFDSLFDTIGFRDIGDGLIKSAVFAVIITVVSCHQGFKTSGGPEAIAASTTKAVVASFILIFASDYFITRLLM